MNKVNQPLLSICIPTYNRAEILYKSLTKMLQNSADYDCIEFVISDNCSSDNTEKVIRDLQSKYENIRYFKNSSNVVFRNFYLALSRGRGTYLRLLNDYISIDKLGFQKMIKFIKTYRETNLNLFFYDHLREPYTDKDKALLQNVNDFVKVVNNKVTWITNFGIWQSQFLQLPTDGNVFPSLLPQMYWTLDLVSKYQTVICNFKYQVGYNVGANRASYNFFRTQVANYYDLLYSYRDKGLIDDSTILFDKKRLLTDFVGAKILDYLYLNKNQVFDLKGSWEILDKYFSDCPYYYKLKRKGQLLRFLKNIHCLKMYGIFCRVRSLFKKL